MKRESKYKKGFTLLEVILVILLMATGFVVILQAMSTGLFAGGQNESDLVAVNLAQYKIEELRNKNYATVVNEAKAVLATPYQQFSREVVISNDTPVASMKEVTVNVYWLAKSDEVKSTLVTYASDI